MFKPLLVALYILITANILSQNDSIYIGFDYNHDEILKYSSRYCMNDVYRVPKRDSLWLNIPNFKYIQPIDQQFCKTLTVSAFRHEMTKFPIFKYEAKALFEITKREVDSIRNLEKNYYSPRKKIYAFLPQTEDNKIDSLARFEIIFNENGSYSGQKIIDAVLTHEDQLRYFTEGKYFDVYPNKLDSLNSLYKKIRDSEIQPKVDDFIQPFYFSQIEITNNEYREFVNWVKDSIAFHALYDSLPNNEAIALLNVSKREKKKLNIESKLENLKKYGFNYQLSIYDNPDYIPFLTFMYYPQPERFFSRREIDKRKLIYKKSDGDSIAIYPDTLQIIKSSNNPDMFIDALVQMYFWHPAYDYYPVQSISYNQILAYCEWKQQKLNELYKDFGLEISYSIPTIYEYEMANKFNQPHYGKHYLENYSNEKYISYNRKGHDEGGFLFKGYYGSSGNIGIRQSEASECTLDEVYFLKRDLWVNSNLNDGQIFFLNGNVSEYSSVPVTKDLIEYYGIDTTGVDLQHLENYCLVLGSNARMDVIDKTGNQNNAIFYKQIIRKDTPGAYFGFRPVIRIKNINPALNKKYLESK
jgi:formylglycine-generating enzyme required for sulfatase activity